MGRARVLSKASGQTEHLYGETRYRFDAYEKLTTYAQQE